MPPVTGLCADGPQARSPVPKGLVLQHPLLLLCSAAWGHNAASYAAGRRGPRVPPKTPQTVPCPGHAPITPIPHAACPTSREPHPAHAAPRTPVPQLSAGSEHQVPGSGSPTSMRHSPHGSPRPRGADLCPPDSRDAALAPGTSARDQPCLETGSLRRKLRVHAVTGGPECHVTGVGEEG